VDDRIERRIDSIEDWINLLREIHTEKEGTKVVREAKENLLRKVSEAVIDIASRIIALQSFERPDTYADYFEVLEDEEIITTDLSKRLKEMAKFRNLVVHQYHKIEMEELNSIIEEDLEDIEKFVSQVERHGNSEWRAKSPTK